MTHTTANSSTVAHLDRGSGCGSNQLATLIAGSPAKATHVSLAIVLGAIENSNSRSTWRSPSVANLAYFAQPAAWGYNLSDVEKIVITEQ